MEPALNDWAQRFRRFAGMAGTGPLCQKLEVE